MAVIVKDVMGVEFEKIINEGKVFVDFYSTICGPCKMLSHVLNEVAKEVNDINIVKLDFDLNKEIVERYAVSGYPTMILFNNGQELGRIKGLQQKPTIIKMINQ